MSSQWLHVNEIQWFVLGTNWLIKAHLPITEVKFDSVLGELPMNGDQNMWRLAPDLRWGMVPETRRSSYARSHEGEITEQYNQVQFRYALPTDRQQIKCNHLTRFQIYIGVFTLWTGR